MQPQGVQPQGVGGATSGWPGQQPKEILTLPPLDEWESNLPISEATGQPRRDPVMLIGMGLLYASAAIAAVGYLLSWWSAMHMEEYFSSANLLQWTLYRPGSWQSVLLAVAVAVAALVMVAAPAISGFQAWNGHRWSRIAAAVAAGLSFLGVLINNVTIAAIPFAVAGAAVLWLPQVTRYFGHWAAFRAPVVKNPRDTSNVSYGPLPRYR